MDEAERRAERQLRQLDVPPGPCGLSVWSAAGAGHTASPGAPWEPLLGLGPPPLPAPPLWPHVDVSTSLQPSPRRGWGAGAAPPRSHAQS